MIEYKLKERTKRKVISISKNKKDLCLDRICNTKPLSMKVGALIFTGLTLLGMTIGTVIGTYVFFGVISLAGLIAIAESNKYVRYFIVKSNKLLDLLIFTGTIYATMSLGITITASLTFAGLGYTLVYVPWLRERNK